MQESAPDPNKPVSTTKNKINFTVSKKNLIIILSVVIAIALLATAYSVGYKTGAKNQKASDAKKQKAATSQSSELPDFIKNRWSIVGTVEEVSGKSITVKNNKGLVQTASINNNTKVSEKSTNKTTIQAVKKGSSVIVIGSKDDNNNFTASMVRIKQ
jgi:hypothetical protein